MYLNTFMKDGDHKLDLEIALSETPDEATKEAEAAADADADAAMAAIEEDSSD